MPNLQQVFDWALTPLHVSLNWWIKACVAYPYESLDPRIGRNEDPDYVAIAFQTIEVGSDFVHIPQLASLGLLSLDIPCDFLNILNGTCVKELALFLIGQLFQHLFARSFKRLDGCHGDLCIGCDGDCLG